MAKRKKYLLIICIMSMISYWLMNKFQIGYGILLIPVFYFFVYHYNKSYFN